MSIMTKKKQRVRFARSLRAQGISGARSFQVSRAVIKAGSPCQVSPVTLASLGLGIIPGGWCPHRFKHFNSEVYCLTTGGSVVLAWYAFNAAR